MPADAALPQPSTLEGEFVRLRPLAVEDAEITCKWRNDPRAQYLNRSVATVEAQARWIASRTGGGEYNFIIELKSGVPVGMLSLLGVDMSNLHAESGRFLIGEEDAAKGAPVAVEAMKLLYQLAFDTLGLHRVHGLVSERNGLMIKWQKYLGMVEEGRFRDHYRVADGYADAVALAILVDDYRRVALPKMNTLIALGRKSQPKTAEGAR